MQNMFWKTFCDLCKQNRTTPSAVIKELGMSTESVTSWKNGAVPNGGVLKQMSEYFGVSIEQLMFGDEISIHPHWKKTGKIGEPFDTLYALPQRFISLRSGKTVNQETLLEIMNFTHCNMRFFFNPSVTEYVPDNSCPELESTSIMRIFCKVLDIFDSCADSDEYRDIQIQLSRVVLFNIRKKGHSEKSLSQTNKFDNEKLHYICTGEENRDTTKNYGFNYSDLANIKELTGLEYYYLFTGEERKIEVVLK